MCFSTMTAAATANATTNVTTVTTSEVWDIVDEPGSTLPAHFRPARLKCRQIQVQSWQSFSIVAS